MAIIDCPGKPAGLDGRQETIEAKIHVVTPMFGGGYEARNPDADFPIRPTAIRGHLQFWWRATHPAPAGMTSAELFAEHEKIWGSTKKKSLVSVQVVEFKAAPARACAAWETRPNGGPRLNWCNEFSGSDNPLPYVAFPFQGTANGSEPCGRYIPNASFRLQVNCPATLRAQVDRALTAWINFGGLGSRTRRGCGSLYANGLSFTTPHQAFQWLLDHSVEASHDWPTICPNMMYGDTTVPVEAMKDVARLLKNFRQGVGIGRNEGEQANRPGRSRFPEPETIRMLTRARQNKHQPMDHPEGFPRAEFGMPIITKFQGERQGDPPITTILPTGGNERMASPLILKAVCTGQEEAFPLILQLNTPLPSHVALKNGRDTVPDSDRIPVQSDQFIHMNSSPMRGYSSALEAFRGYAADCGYRQGGN